MPIELGFILKRLAEMAEADESLRGKQPWKAARERDYRWLSEVITKHYHGDDGCSTTSPRTASRTTSHPAVIAISCDRSRRRSTTSRPSA